MKVENMILYQVATDRNYKVGDKLYFGKEYNGQYYRCVNASFNKGGKTLHEIGFESVNKGVLKNKGLIIDLSKALSDYDFVIREFALEEVRRNKFMHLPSRLTCMYLSETKETCLANFDEMVKCGKGKQYQAVSVKVSGETHFVKGFGVGRLGLSFEEYKKKAEMYWGQNQTSSEEAKEILFEGEVEIVEVLKEATIN